jgi:hypothetical protein
MIHVGTRKGLFEIARRAGGWEVAAQVARQFDAALRPLGPRLHPSQPVRPGSAHAASPPPGPHDGLADGTGL